MTAGRRVGVAGWFGSGNLGDEVLLATVGGLVAERGGQVALVLAADPAAVTRVHGTPAVALPGGRGLLHGPTRAALRRQLADLDLLVIGPGTVFQERTPVWRWPATFPTFVGLVRVAREVGTPVVLLGVGVREGGTPLGGVALRWIARRAVGVGTRDADTLAAFGGPAADGTRVEVGDVAVASALLARVPVGAGRAGAGPGTGGRTGRPVVGVSLRPLPQAPHLGDVVVAALDAQDPSHVVGFRFACGTGGAVGEDDAVALEALAALAPAARAAGDEGAGPAPSWSVELVDPPLAGPLVDGWDPWWARFRACDVVLATRLHALVFALVAGVPVVALAYEGKVARYARRHGVAALDPATVTAAELGAALTAARHDERRAVVGRRRGVEDATALRRWLARTLEGVG